MEREKEKETRKIKVERGKIEERKEGLLRESQNKLKEMKRDMDKTWMEKTRQKRVAMEEEIDKGKEEGKKQVLMQTQLKEGTLTQE